MIFKILNILEIPKFDCGTHLGTGMAQSTFGRVFCSKTLCFETFFKETFLFFKKRFAKKTFSSSKITPGLHKIIPQLNNFFKNTLFWTSFSLQKHFVLKFFLKWHLFSSKNFFSKIKNYSSKITSGLPQSSPTIESF